MTSDWHFERSLLTTWKGDGVGVGKAGIGDLSHVRCQGWRRVVS